MFVFSNLAMSLDGKIGTSARGFLPLGTPRDLQQMQLLRKKCDAILMGATTLRSFHNPCKIKNSTRQPTNVILTSKLEKISSKWPFFTDPQIKRIIFTSQPTSAARLKEFSRSCEVIALKTGSRSIPVAQQILTHLEKRGLRRLLIEGGGGVMWDFVSQHLIDEYHVTLTPKILGGTQAPTLVDGRGFSPTELLHLKLRQAKRVGDELFLTYTPTTKRK